MPTTKTRKTLKLLDALTGKRQFTNEEIRAANAEWRVKSDAWVKDPASSHAPRFYDAQATFEWALTQPDNIFGFGKPPRWAFFELPPGPLSSKQIRAFREWVLNARHPPVAQEDYGMRETREMAEIRSVLELWSDLPWSRLPLTHAADVKRDENDSTLYHFNAELHALNTKLLK